MFKHDLNFYRKTDRIKKEIFLHIGLPKSGSTFLQNNVFPLLSPSELCFNPPEISRDLLPNFMRKAHVKRGYSKKDFEDFRIEIKRILSKIKQNKILLSNEGLCGLHFGSELHQHYLRKFMHDLFPRAKIIIVFRDQVEWFRSLYSLSISYGYFVPFNRFLNYRSHSFHPRKNEKGWSVNALDYEHFKIYDYYNAFFKDINIINFKYLKEDPNKFIKLFEEILDCRPIGRIQLQKVNVSLPYNELKMIGIISRILFYEYFWEEKFTYFSSCFKLSPIEKLRKIFIKMLYDVNFILGKILGRIFFSADTDLYSKEQKDILKLHYKASNKTFWTQHDLTD